MKYLKISTSSCICLLFVFSLFLAGSAGQTEAQAPLQNSPFEVTLEAPSAMAPPGEAGSFSLQLTIPDDHKVYRESLAVSLETVDGLILGDVIIPGDNSLETLTGSQTIQLSVSVPEKAQPDTTFSGSLKLMLQGCKGDMCFMPEERVFPVSLSVFSITGPGTVTTAAHPPIDPAPVQEPSPVETMTTPLADPSAMVTPPFTTPLVVQELFPTTQPPTQGPIREPAPQEHTAAVGTGTPAPKKCSSASCGSKQFESESTVIQKLRSTNWLIMLGIVYAAGLVLSLTPCVYPMLIITLTIVGAHGENKSALRGFILSGTYVLGIAITFAVLGLAAAAAGSLFGSWLQNPWAMGVLSLIFFILALGMFDVYQFKGSQSLAGDLAKLSGKGLIGVFIMGLISGLVLSPCTGPVLVGLLTYIAETGNLVYGFALLFTMALGMGTLMVAVGTFAGLAKKLPKAGTWMVMVRNFFGLLLMGMALYYARLALPGSVWLILAGLITTGLGVALRTLLAEDAGDIHPKPKKFKYVAIATLGLALITVGLTIIATSTFSALFDQSLKAGGNKMVDLTVKTGGGPVESQTVSRPEAVHWESDLDSARKSGKTVMVDLFADWCTACGQLDRETFSDPVIIEHLSRMIAVRVDVTRNDKRSKKIMDELWSLFNFKGPRTLPKLMFFDAAGNPLPAHTISGFVPPEKLLPVLYKVNRTSGAAGQSGG